MTRPPGRMLRVGGVALHVLCEGAGPVCVLSGGLGSAWFDWDAVAPLLTPHRTVIRFDRPGLGLSAPAPTTQVPTAAGEAHRILGVLDALGVSEPCTVVGHSLAGFHAEAFARLHPDRTAGLVLLDGSVEERPRPLPALGLRLAATRALATALTAVGAPYALGGVVRRLTVRATTVGPHTATPEESRCYRTGRTLRAVLLEDATYADVAAELLALRARSPLPAVPITVLAAYDDGDSPHARRWLARQRQLAATLGTPDVRVASPAGHLVMYDAPQTVAQAVLDASRP